MSKVMLNPDTKVVEAIRKRLVITDGFCPCVSQEVWNDDYKCPCKKFREEKECCCQLYVKLEEN